MTKTFIALEFDIDEDSLIDREGVQEVEEMLRRAVVATVDDHCKQLAAALHIRLVGSCIGKQIGRSHKKIPFLNYSENDQDGKDPSGEQK